MGLTDTIKNEGIEKMVTKLNAGIGHRNLNWLRCWLIFPREVTLAGWA
jgi:hypothetical protein